MASATNYCKSARSRDLSTLAFRNLLKKFTLMKLEEALLRAWLVFELFLVSISLSISILHDIPFYYIKTARRMAKAFIGYLSWLFSTFRRSFSLLMRPCLSLSMAVRTQRSASFSEVMPSYVKTFTNRSGAI